MINPNNPNLARPETLFQGFAHFDIATHRFSGKKSFDGQVGGFPLLYDKEKPRAAKRPVRWSCPPLTFWPTPGKA